MRFVSALILSTLPMCALAETSAAFQKAVQPFFEQHCLDCHDSSEQKGGLNLEALKPSFATRDECAQWTRIFDRLERGEMPPPKKSRPTAATQKDAMHWIGMSIYDAETKRHTTEGRAAWRRLNRNEYQNTIRDLLFVDVDVKSMLPEDGLASGFDNVDEALDVSSIHLEKYLEAADAALDAAIQKTATPLPQKWHYSFLEDKREIARSIGKQILALSDAAVFTNELYPPKRMDNFRAPYAGNYKFRFSAYAWQTERTLPAMIYAGSQNPQRGKTELTKVFDVPPGQPVVREWIDHMEKGDTVRIVTKGPNKGFNDSVDTYKGPGLAVQWMEAEGPIGEGWPPPSVKNLLGSLDLKNGTQADAEKVLRGFAPRAFRRSVTDAELEPYFTLVQQKLDLGGTFEEALRVALKAMLVSPDFLFFKAAPGKLDDYALASRLSYFLWSSMPDQALLSLAAKRQLTPGNLRKEVERMLADPKAKAFTENFTGLWLKLRDIKSTMPDKKLYPEFDELLEWSMVQETHEFFDEVLRKDLSLLSFVQSDFAMLNSRLAELYGIPGVEGLNFRKVALQPDWHRGGVLTQAAVMKVTANGTNTSPVVRGAFFLDRILGRPSPPPPKNVAAIEPDTRGATTIRAQLEKHRNVELCATCHTRIDPPGAALESYDVIGGFREKYRAITANYRDRVPGPDGRRSYGYGLPCETDAALPDGRKFTNIDEFKKLMLDDATTRDQIARNVTEKLLTYATGHELDFADRATVTDILNHIRTKNCGFRTLVHEVVQSPTFQNK
jgi:mono/diheme cytochrome c family protein